MTLEGLDESTLDDLKLLGL